jgi:very-short-patch-repair endonuclease
MARDEILLERAKQMRKEPSPFEQKLWLALRAKRWHAAKFGRYIADFVCRTPRMLIVEVDGETHAEQTEYDRVRTEELERRGYRLLRFANADVRNNFEGVLMATASALALPLSPALSPEGERG